MVLEKELQSVLEKAIILATTLHAGQVDKSDKPYILHPLRVMENVEATECKILAVLHDVLEDCDIAADELIEAGIPAYLVEKLTILTKQKGEPYFDYIDRVKSDELARLVKLGDLKDNMNLDRLKEVTEKDLRRNEKYKKAKEILEQEE